MFLILKRARKATQDLFQVNQWFGVHGNINYPILLLKTGQYFLSVSFLRFPSLCRQALEPEHPTNKKTISAQQKLQLWSLLLCSLLPNLKCIMEGSQLVVWVFPVHWLSSNYPLSSTKLVLCRLLVHKEVIFENSHQALK